MSEGGAGPILDVEALAEALEQLHLATGALVQAVPSFSRDGWDVVPPSEPASAPPGASPQTSSAHQVPVPKVGPPFRFRPPPSPPVLEPPLEVAPPESLVLCSSLARAVRASRALRAWNAGISAGNVLRGASSCMDKTPDLVVRNRVYIVLRHSSGSPPATYLTFSAFKAAVGQLDWHCVCHGFPTEGEARAYCAGASRP